MQKLFWLFFLFTLSAHAFAEKGWMWHGTFPWVYSHSHSEWWYMHSGADGKFYAYRNGDKEWYVFSESLNDWAPASKTVVELKKEGASSLIEGNYHDALTSFEKALASSIDKYGQDDPRTAEAYEGIGYAQNSLGDYSGALGSHEKALSIRLKPKVIANRHNFLRTNYLTGRDCPAFHER